MKKILLLILLLISTPMFSQEEDMKSNIGTRIDLDDKQFTIVSFSFDEKTYTLSNGLEISVNLYEKLKKITNSKQIEKIKQNMREIKVLRIQRKLKEKYDYFPLNEVTCDMVIYCIGIPSSINIKVEQDTLQRWCYSDGSYIYFKDSKIKKIECE